MKRTTIMIEEELLHVLQQIAKQRNESVSSIIREALELYVVEQQECASSENPLLSLVGLGTSANTTDVMDGGDELMLAEAVDTVTGWRFMNDSDQ